MIEAHNEQRQRIRVALINILLILVKNILFNLVQATVYKFNERKLQMNIEVVAIPGVFTTIFGRHIRSLLLLEPGIKFLLQAIR